MKNQISSCAALSYKGARLNLQNFTDDSTYIHAFEMWVQWYAKGQRIFPYNVRELDDFSYDSGYNFSGHAAYVDGCKKIVAIECQEKGEIVSVSKELVDKLASNWNMSIKKFASYCEFTSKKQF